MAVMVLDKRKQPLMPCSEKRARLLLDRGRAVVHRTVPFVIRLKDRTAEGSAFQDVRVKLDPGSKTTGVAVVREPANKPDQPLFLAEITHRGQTIRNNLTKRRAQRRRRRSNRRYRPARFNNRRRRDGWLPPSLQHRVDTTVAWVDRLTRWLPVRALSQELVRFDTHQLHNPEVAGVAYQQGELFGYEVREYLLEKWGRQCAYCDTAGVPLQVEHIQPKSRGGSDRVSNLTIACGPCNHAKGNRPIQDFLAADPDRADRILSQAKAPLADAAAVNATRWALRSRLIALGFDVEVASGGRTKYNRARLGIPKAHCLDALCVGTVTRVRGWQQPVLCITAAGRGSYQRTRLNRHGFPRGYLTRRKQIHGFQTGDRVKAVVPHGKKAGTHRGRVAVRATGRFNIQTPDGVVQGLSHRHCTLIQRGDGYGYSFRKTQEDAGRVAA